MSGRHCHYCCFGLSSVELGAGTTSQTDATPFVWSEGCCLLLNGRGPFLGAAVYGVPFGAPVYCLSFFAVCYLRCGTFDRNHRHLRPCAEVLELNQSRQPSPPDSSSYPNSLPDPLTETLQQIGGGFSLESRQRGIFRDQQAQRTLQVYGVSTVRAMGSSFPCTCTSATGRELSFPHCTHARTHMSRSSVHAVAH
jgi:hypothetical protein